MTANGTEHSLDAWLNSYEQAEIAEFKESDPDLRDWPLAKFLCELVDQEEEIKADTEILSAALSLLEEEGYNDGFSSDFFRTVLSSRNGKTGDSFAALCDEYADDHFEPGEPEDPRSQFDSFISENDFESWYKNNALPAGELYAESSAGGTLYFFKKTW